MCEPHQASSACIHYQQPRVSPCCKGSTACPAAADVHVLSNLQAVPRKQAVTDSAAGQAPCPTDCDGDQRCEFAAQWQPPSQRTEERTTQSWRCSAAAAAAGSSNSRLADRPDLGLTCLVGCSSPRIPCSYSRARAWRHVLPLLRAVTRGRWRLPVAPKQCLST